MLYRNVRRGVSKAKAKRELHYKGMDGLKSEWTA